MSVEKSSTVEIKCRNCGDKDNFILPSVISDAIMGYVTRFDVKYTCFNCASLEEALYKKE